ncbi:MAG: 50S ribosomal protein L25 [Deltaproteobacteria bacterium]|nr:50S ribosomal protein L25 [Deltaproteobacteria bacterium]
MTHTEVEFALESKTAAGKGPARQTRAAGKVPAVVYGPDLEPVMVTFKEQELVKALSTPAGRNVFLRLKTDDAKLDGARVIVKELQVHPIKRVFTHADFYRLDPAKVIHANVPVRFEGTAIGVKLGGILQIAQRDVSVACLPDDLPEAIVLDVTELKPGHSIHVQDLQIPEGVRVLSDPRLALCAVIAAGYEEGGTEGGASA